MVGAQRKTMVLDALIGMAVGLAATWLLILVAVAVANRRGAITKDLPASVERCVA
ncbi:MAG: hypothetical protein JO337_12100 [Acidimicrobiales bacterium]|nr:hypothetical protein [Acidimicrobiales bacterium]